MFIKEFELAKNIATNTARMLNDKYLTDVGIISNNAKDIKTEADNAAHEYISESLINTGIPIVSEEGDNKIFNLSKRQWIIDPIDGTLNFSRGFNMSAISISLWDEGTPILGVVHHLFTNEVFTSFQNRGAYKSGKKISMRVFSEKKEIYNFRSEPSESTFNDILNNYKEIAIKRGSKILEQTFQGNYQRSL